MTNDTEFTETESTERRTESQVRTTIQTVLHRIDGRISTSAVERLQEKFNAQEPFLTVVGATVFDADGNDLYRSTTIVVNRSHIIWAIPYEDEFD